ncbi:neprilysin-like [Palaemon carinicauda]|uniref:neprilysin-like n=1 Tax=Palaemon carinicauda TaxID=392227 RepID=UPI0035B5C4D0
MRRWRERVLCVIVLLLLLVCSGLITIIITDRLKDVPIPKEEVCTTPECLRAASRLLDRMDRTVSPCSDFYQFACGNYLHENVVPDDSLYRSAMQEMQEDVLVIIKKMLDLPHGDNDTDAFGKAKRLYHSCMNTNGVIYKNSNLEFWDSKLKTERIATFLKLGDFLEDTDYVHMSDMWSIMNFNLNNLRLRMEEYFHEVNPLNYASIQNPFTCITEHLPNEPNRFGEELLEIKSLVRSLARTGDC